MVLFIGPDYAKRLKEARQLIKEKYSKAVIIPAYHREYTMVDGILKVIKNYQITGFDRKDYPSYYENTHIEILEAKKNNEHGRIHISHICQLSLSHEADQHNCSKGFC